jgi:predicted CXXCH cytochrome family protein
VTVPSSSRSAEGGAVRTGPTAPADAPAAGKKRARRLAVSFWVALLALQICACDPLTVHKVTTTIFDGVPAMPPAEQYCKEFHEQAVQDEIDATKKLRLAQLGALGSNHPPYAEKRCNACHDKNTESGFITATADLCLHCHVDFLKGEYYHGPAAVGACLKCHVPHSSQFPSLLAKPKGEICTVCHVEVRVAQAMHAKVTSSGMVCSDCHDPHGGNNHYFLR